MENKAVAGGLDFREIENWQTNSKIGNYLVNRSFPNEYRDAGRSGDCDFSKNVGDDKPH